MANEPENIQEAWRVLAQSDVCISKEFWLSVDTFFLPRLVRVQDLIESAGKNEMSVPMAEEVLFIAKELKIFVDNICTFSVQSVEGRAGIQLGHSLAKQVLGHNLRNDLYIIMLLIDVGESNPLPIDVASVRKIHACVQTMFRFWERFRMVIGKASDTTF